LVRACQLHAGLTGLGATCLGSLERLQDGTVARHPVNRRFSCTQMGNHLLHLDGRDLTALPLEERKAALQALVGEQAAGIVYVTWDGVFDFAILGIGQ